MKKHLIIALLGLSIFATACSDDNSGDDPIVDNGNVVVVSGDIKASTTWTADKIYLIKGFTYVTDAATLTIQPGTIIKGDKDSKGTLIITRGSKIIAEGTVDKPIVFTSNIGAGSRSKGDWGGLVLLGNAPGNNGTTAVIEGGPIPTVAGQDAKYIQYGGTVPADNSGILKYVRVEYAGIAYAVDSEINGITFGGVGSGTTVEYVQVYRSGDDAFEFFGGTVNAKHLVSVGTWDDDFDTDNGFSGNIQFAVAQRYPLEADQSGSNGFESDNDKTGSLNAPKTSAVFSNVTIVGPMSSATTKINGFYQHAAQIRRNSAISIFNSVFAGYPEGIFIDDASTLGLTSANFTSTGLVFANNLVYGANSKSNELKGTVAGKAIFETSIRANNVFDNTLYAGALLTSPYLYPADISATGVGSPMFTLLTGSLASTGALFTDAKVSGTFFEKVAYKGAFGTADWTAGWANFAPQAMPYTTPGAVK
ncbi:hypothetical protein ADIARSV_3838 [Arcticibacter svalbardensis MN12-7]|uniref:T9SS C-terminal target domain-containing protein n=1 Tax=Arcticibacter svalbardensis MN12-7 TaxID=1150600 RepID=R9GMQ0_9SPHI|nr:hypothetical protein [Arcticibacter svalbardensis]EOR92986.1 hypothetical protein ADIARSV_3838 [Arcticibacter svalbardensis MN12-7]